MKALPLKKLYWEELGSGETSAEDFNGDMKILGLLGRAMKYRVDKEFAGEHGIEVLTLRTVMARVDGRKAVEAGLDMVLQGMASYTYSQ